MDISRLFKTVAKFAAKDQNRHALTKIRVLRNGKKWSCAAADGHRAAVFEAELPEIEPAWALPAGLYDAKDWADLICKGRYQAAPEPLIDFPDLEQVLPAERPQEYIDIPGADGTIRKVPSGHSVVGIDPKLAAPLGDLTPKWRWQISDELTPVLLTATVDIDGISFNLRAVIMPIRLE